MSNKNYYYNAHTGDTVWSKPPEGDIISLTKLQATPPEDEATPLAAETTPPGEADYDEVAPDELNDDTFAQVGGACCTTYILVKKSKFSDSGQKPWTIIRHFDRNRAHSLCSFYSSLEGATRLKLAPFCSP